MGRYSKKYWDDNLPGAALFGVEIRYGCEIIDNETGLVGTTHDWMASKTVADDYAWEDLMAKQREYYKNRSKEKTRKLSEYIPPIRIDGDDTGLITLLIKWGVYIGMFIFAIWIAFAVALPLIIINISLISLVIGLISKSYKKQLFLLSLLGGVFVLLDYNEDWVSKTLVKNVSFLAGLMPFFLYLNIATGLIAGFFLIRDLVNEKRASIEGEGGFSRIPETGFNETQPSQPAQQSFGFTQAQAEIPDDGTYIMIFDQKVSNLAQLGQVLFENPDGAQRYLADEVLLKAAVTTLTKNDVNKIFRLLKIYKSATEPHDRYLKIVYYLNPLLIPIAKEPAPTLPEPTAPVFNVEAGKAAPMMAERAPAYSMGVNQVPVSNPEPGPAIIAEPVAGPLFRPQRKFGFGKLTSPVTNLLRSSKGPFILSVIIVLIIVSVAFFFIYRSISRPPVDKKFAAAAVIQAGPELSSGGLYNRGNELYLKKNYKDAFSAFKASDSVAANDKSECMLGNLYYMGLGVTQSDSAALKWYLKSSVQKNPAAMYALGIIYANGGGEVKKDVFKAYQYLTWVTENATDETTRDKAKDKLRLINEQ